MNALTTWKREKTTTERHGKTLEWTDYVSSDGRFRITEGIDEAARLERGEPYALLERHAHPSPSAAAGTGLWRYGTPHDGLPHTYRTLAEAKVAAAGLAARSA